MKHNVKLYNISDGKVYLIISTDHADHTRPSFKYEECLDKNGNLDSKKIEKNKEEFLKTNKNLNHLCSYIYIKSEGSFVEMIDSIISELCVIKKTIVE